MKIPILTYHAIGQGPLILTTPLSTFQSQVRRLLRGGYQSISFSELGRGRHQTPKRPVILTFDDAYCSIEPALEYLAQQDLGATIFVPTAYCGRSGGWPGAGGPVLDWQALRKWSRTGFEVGSHGVDHIDLCRLNSAGTRGQLRQSKEEIQAHLGTRCRALAYPFGSCDRRVLLQARDYYRFAVTTRLAWALPSVHPLALPRIEMYYFQRPFFWQHFDDRAGALYLSARRLLRSLKRQ
ncbi:MAG: polysaccharide deacetylase family protein [Acidobacteriota bacterium]